MTQLVPPEDIERIVGYPRHRLAHFGRMVPKERTVYILHSQACRDETEDLRDCRFSIALDAGVDEGEWSGAKDCPVLLGVRGGRLYPVSVFVSEGPQ